VVESSAFRAVYRFTSTTLRRSEVHQGVLIGLSACGVALASNRLVGAGWLGPIAGQKHDRAFLEYLAIWTPFALMFIYGLSVRAAIALPITHRANWIFRLTETAATRSDQMRAVERIVIGYTVGLPLAAGLPVLWSVIGWKDAAIATLIVAFVGGVFVHGVLSEWRRIPFTCSYMPGKRLIVYTVVPGCAAFVLFPSRRRSARERRSSCDRNRFRHWHRSARACGNPPPAAHCTVERNAADVRG
jgi:biotin transporter BioY